MGTDGERGCARHERRGTGTWPRLWRAEELWPARFRRAAAPLSLGRAVMTTRGLAGASELLHTMSTTSVRQNKAIALFDAGLAIVAATRCAVPKRSLATSLGC